MTVDDVRARARAVVTARFRWIDGDADVWRLVETGPDLAAVTDALAAPFADAGVTHVAGIEARGFLLGGAVAHRLSAGFVPIRKDGALFPGGSLVEDAAPDYRERRWRLRLRPDGLDGARVLLVDDWAERGSQALAARRLLEQAGATFGGTSLIVDQLPATVRAQLAPVTAIVAAEELPECPT
ncbi:MAG: phosphoribosyltransferase [Acidimicrobiia bacterium]